MVPRAAENVLLNMLAEDHFKKEYRVTRRNVQYVLLLIGDGAVRVAQGGFRLMKSIDDLDRAILRELQTNARISNAELAERVGLSASPCWQRVKRLEDAGYIEGYMAILDQKRLGFPDTVIIEVTLEKHDDEVLERFGQALTNLPEVLEAYLTTGEYDYFVKVAVDGTEGYERFLRERLYRIPGIRHTRSCFALRCLKRRLSVTP